jgi:hypothetical protein
MPDAEDVAQWIRDLSSSSDRKRKEAAASLFSRGLEQASSVLGRLGPNPEYRALTHSLQPGSDPQDPVGPPRFIVGVAVEPRSFEKIRAANGSPSLADVPPEQDAMEFELQFDNHVELDILTTGDPQGTGAIARFLKKSGEGIQQVELYVRDVERATEILRTELSVQPIYPAMRAGANRTRVNFFLLPGGESGKVLLELVESTP